MQHLDLTITGMSCNHCVRAVRQAIHALGGAQVEQVAVGHATATFDPASLTPDQIVAAVEKKGYAVAHHEVRP